MFEDLRHLELPPYQEMDKLLYGIFSFWLCPIPINSLCSAAQFSAWGCCLSQVRPGCRQLGRESLNLISGLMLVRKDAPYVPPQLLLPCPLLCPAISKPLDPH